MLFQQNDINPCLYKRFCDNLDLEQHGDDFLVCGLTSNLEVLADEFKNNFLVKKAEIVSLKPEHQNEIQTSHQCAGDESLQIDGREFRSGAGICCQYMTKRRIDFAFSTKEIMRGAAGPTTASKTKLKNRALLQRTSAMCTEFPLGGKAGRLHVTADEDWSGDPKTRSSTSGVLAIGPCFTLRHWSVTQATVSLSSAESEAQGDHEGLHMKRQRIPSPAITQGETLCFKQGEHLHALRRARTHLANDPVFKTGTVTKCRFNP